VRERGGPCHLRGARPLDSCWGPTWSRGTDLDQPAKERPANQPTPLLRLGSFANWGLSPASGRCSLSGHPAVGYSNTVRPALGRRKRLGRESRSPVDDFPSPQLAKAWGSWRLGCRPEEAFRARVVMGRTGGSWASIARAGALAPELLPPFFPSRAHRLPVRPAGHHFKHVP